MNFSDLDNELLANVLCFSAPRDVESLTVASSIVALHVLPLFPLIWKNIFRRRWESLNFSLEDDAPLEINDNLDALFPSSCTESRRFQLLAHAIVPVPSYADIGRTKTSLGYTDAYHRIIPMKAPELIERDTVDFALDGGMLGDDRCVRANVAFPTTLHVAVYKRNSTDEDTAKGKTRVVYQIGIFHGGYFELSLSKRQHQHTSSPSMFGQDSMTSIGLVNSTFPLVGKQPGWTRRSYGYHGDDGRFYHGTAFEGRHFGPVFKAGCTVGCGIRVDSTTGTMFVFFTNNGELITGDNGAFVASERRNLYPAVGLDSYDALHLNFGQEPFVYSNVMDELFNECNGMGRSALEQLQWNNIYDFDSESSKGEDNNVEDESGDDFMFDEQISASLIARILALRQAGVDIV
ncbi:unnamed protein product [Peronospora belbahrii]|uniref:B30.2/SPRY domain-containing protein n=1 Tax=Peronospora belbahrii TaxID=622444 RepID=A0ABN8CSU2_9STRA|nr:unnamed protein product [Peronospora belbahrii]